MANWNKTDPAEYEDHEDGLYDFSPTPSNETSSHVTDNGIPVTSHITNANGAWDYSQYRPNVWDRITGNTDDALLSRMNPGSPEFWSGNVLDLAKSPVMGNNSVYDPSTGSTYGVVDHNMGRDFFGNLINTIANPMPGLAHSFNSARLKDDLTGDIMNFESHEGLLSDSRIVSDAQIEEEMRQRNLDQQRQSDSNDPPDNTGGMLATRDDNGDIPWWVLANAGLLAV